MFLKMRVFGELWDLICDIRMTLVVIKSVENLRLGRMEMVLLLFVSFKLFTFLFVKLQSYDFQVLLNQFFFFFFFF